MALLVSAFPTRAEGAMDKETGDNRGQAAPVKKRPERLNRQFTLCGLEGKRVKAPAPGGGRSKPLRRTSLKHDPNVPGSGGKI